MTNKGMETYVHCFAGGKPKTWAKYLPWAELRSLSHQHDIILCCSYGREAPSLMKFELGSTTNAELDMKLKERDETLELLKKNLHRSQQLMKQRSDGHKREVEFKVGDEMFLKLRPYRQQSFARRANEKVAERFYGPFTVEARVGKVSYKLKLPEEAKIHPTFHISQLKKKAVGEVTNSISIHKLHLHSVSST